MCGAVEGAEVGVENGEVRLGLFGSSFWDNYRETVEGREESGLEVGGEEEEGVGFFLSKMIGQDVGFCPLFGDIFVLMANI